LILDFQYHKTLEIIQGHEIPISLMIMFIILHFVSYKKQNLVEKISNFSMYYWFLIVTICMMSIVLFYGGSAKEFIYFKF